MLVDVPTSAPKPSLRQRVVALANSPYAFWALVAVSIADASFFPIAPFALLVPMLLARPRRWLTLCIAGTVASFLGGILGYGIGTFFHDVAIRVLHIDLNAQVNSNLFHVHSTVAGLLADRFWILALLCTVLPTPFKVVAIGSGLVAVPLPKFLLASAIGRAIRFLGFGGSAAIAGFRLQRAEALPVVENRA